MLEAGIEAAFREAWESYDRGQCPDQAWLQSRARRVVKGEKV